MRRPESLIFPHGTIGTWSTSTVLSLHSHDALFQRNEFVIHDVKEARIARDPKELLENRDDLKAFTEIQLTLF